MNTMTNDNAVETSTGIQDLLSNLGDAISEIDDVDAQESLLYCQTEIESWLQKNVFLTPPCENAKACQPSPPHRTVITITLPIRLDYLGFITEFDDSDNYLVSVQNGLLVIEEVVQP